jgi:C-terminal processing protease CtpA/Prc
MSSARLCPTARRFVLPNEVSLTEGGKHFEVVGVPPDIKVLVFPRGDLEAGRDTTLDKAPEILKMKDE